MNPITIDWETTGMDDISAVRVNDRTILATVRFYPYNLRVGVYEVLVTYGPGGTQQCGTVRVRK